MHSIQEVLIEIREESTSCAAVERDGTICFNKKDNRSKYCSKHKKRFYKYGCFDLPRKKIKKCKFIDCENKNFAKEYCEKHYNKYLYAPKNKLKKCKVENCSKKRVSVNPYCGMHQTRKRKYGTLEGNGIKPHKFQKGHTVGRKRINHQCIVPNCNATYLNDRIVKGLCKKHYIRWNKFKDYNIASKKNYLEKLKRT